MGRRNGRRKLRTDLDVTSLVPPCEAAHRTARHGTMDLLWLFGDSQQSARAGRSAGDGLDRVPATL